MKRKNTDINRKREQEKERGGNQLRPEQAVDTDGKREHEIALVSEEVLVEALDHQNGGEDHHAKTRQHIDNGEQDADNIEDARGIRHLLQDLICDAGKDSQQQERAEQRRHQTACGAELVFDQFSQHLNTSRNRASTDWPRVSRISSQLSCSATCP